MFDSSGWLSGSGAGRGGFALGWLLSLLLSVPAAAQTTGTIEGTVTGPDGAPLPGATVTLAGAHLQGTRAATTGRDGGYRFPAIPPGAYVVTAQLEGFGSRQLAATLTLDATSTVNLQLSVAATAEVTVTGEAPLIDQTSTTTGTSYTSRVISNLPVARNYADIVKSNPGVSTDRGDTEGRSLALAIYGATSAENQWIIDGVNTTNAFKGVQGKAINNEFVQEVEVKTGAYQAEYGRALGGIINVITKSGGNQYHGDGFAYYDSTATAAEKQIRPGDAGFEEMRVVAGSRWDYGLDVGGFLLKDRLWFFGAYNRVSISSELSTVEPTDQVPTSARFPLDSANNLYSGKLTWNVASSTTVVGSVFADPSTNAGAAGADPRQGLGVGQVTPPVSLDPSTWYSSRFQGGTDFGLRVTQLFGSQALATIQGAYHKDKDTLEAPGSVRVRNLECEGGTPDNPCAFPPVDAAVSGGYGLVYGPNDNNASERQQYAAVLTFYAGNHEIKFGGDYENGSSEILSFFSGEQLVRIQNEYGQPYYAHRFYAVSLDDPTPVVNWPSSARVLDYGAFLQDSWKVTPGLTLNVGLRWDGETTKNYLGRTVLNFDNAWQPRVGVTWDPWQDGRTKIFAFAGRFSYALPTVAAALSFGSFALLQTYNFDPVSVIQNPNVINHSQYDVLGGGIYGDPVDPNLRGWYQDEATLGIERLISPTLTVGLKGTYRTLRNVVEDRCDLDYNVPETNYNSCGLMNPGTSDPIASGHIPTCNGLDPPDYQCGIDPGPAAPAVSRIYRGLEFFVRQSIGNTMWIQASYIYSSLTGNYDGGVNEGQYGQSWPGINQDFDYPQMWHNASGHLGLDRTNRFRFDGFWTTPWQLTLGLQAYAESGVPLNRLGYLNQYYGTVIFLDPRGSAGRLPTLWGANLQLAYPIVFGPVTVTLQAALLNVFNKQIAISKDENWSIEQPPGYPATIYDPNQPQSNPYYGSVTGRSDPRVFRTAVKVSF